jgi:exonuclease VII small subunit
VSRDWHKEQEKMKKLILSFVCALGMSSIVSAQSAAEKVVPLEKSTTRPGFCVIYNASVKDVNLAVKNRMSKEGLKGKSYAKNVLKYEQVNKPQICAQTCDLYIKVEASGKATALTCFVSKGYDNYVSSSNDPETANLAKAFAEGFKKDVDAVAILTQIAAQEKVLKKAESTYKKSVSTRDKAKKQLDEAEKNVQKLDSERAKQKSLLDELKAKSN